MSAARRKSPFPAKPTSFFTQSLSFCTAFLRQISNASSRDIPCGNSYKFRVPPAGKTILVLANAILLVVLLFYGFDSTKYINLKLIAYRAGFLSLGQIPLIFLLSGKNNLIGLFTGHSYERLNYLHRWCGRTLLLTVTLHFAYWLGDWSPYHWYRDDKTTRTGLTCWAILIWMFLTGLRPIRNWQYEFFVYQHLVSFITLVIMILVHTPSDVHAWVWIGIGIMVLDRAIRSSSLMRNNLDFTFWRKRGNILSIIWRPEAEITPLSHGMTRVTIYDPPIKWKPGQHVFLGYQSISPLQQHPFCISSIPSDGKLEFLIKAHQGGTRKLYLHAKKHSGLPTSRELLKRDGIPAEIDGPYGNMRPLHQFDSIVFLAGGTGATFTTPLLRDLVGQWKQAAGKSRGRFKVPHGLIHRRLRYIWVVKLGTQLDWFSEGLGRALEDVKGIRDQGYDIELFVSVYVTSDRSFASEYNASSRASSRPSSAGPRQSRFFEKMGNGQDGDELSRQPLDDKRPPEESYLDPRAAPLPSAPGLRQTRTCQPDGTCCCQVSVRSEKSGMGPEQGTCNCNDCSHCPKTPRSFRSFSRPMLAGQNPLQSHPQLPLQLAPSRKLHKDIALLSGRPHPRTIIRTTLEKAEGETAVVSCWPLGLNDDVR